MNGRLIALLLLHILTITEAVEETVCRDGVQQMVDEPTPSPPFICEDLEWPDDKEMVKVKVDPEEMEFVFGERFTITCKVCTRSSDQLTVTDVQWSKKDGELPEDVRVGIVNLQSRPAEASLIFSHPSASDEGVYKCTPLVNLTDEVPGPIQESSEEATASSLSTQESIRVTTQFRITTQPHSTNQSRNTTQPQSTTQSSVTTQVPVNRKRRSDPNVVTKALDTDEYVVFSVTKLVDACAGDDPRFSIPLGNGNMLCFSVDGKGGDIFNLISDANISVNVKYIDGTDGFSVWMGEVAFVLDTGCKVRVNANPESVLVGNMAVTKQYYDGDVEVHVHSGDYVAVTFIKLQVKFHVEFIDGHLSFYIVDAQGFSPRVHGLIGQFLNSKHEIVQAKDGHKLGLLKLQRRTRALVLKQKRWPFMRGHKEATCWGIQGKHPKGAVDWSHSIYKLVSLCHTKHRILTRPVSSLFNAVDTTL